jgi:sugar diacid utilization regulator
MASAPVTGIAADAVRGERVRILSTLLHQIDAVAHDAVVAIRTEVPAYQHEDDRFFADVHEQVVQHYRTNLSALLEDRMVTQDDLVFGRSAASRRARAGLALADYLSAFRVGRRVLWEAVVDCAADTPVGHEATLSLVMPLMRYTDLASANAANAYIEYQQYVVADADRERRDLLEHLLAGELPQPGPLLAAAQRYGIEEETRMLVAVAVPAQDPPDAATPDAASAAITRVGLREATTLVVVRQAEIVAVPSLGPDAEATELCARIERLQDRLRKELVPLAIGISTVASGVAELPRAYLEARAALECVAADGGVAALPRLTPFDYLARRAEDTARRLVDPRLRTFLDEDRARGGVLVATIRAFAEADLNLRVAAERLQVHPNTAQYRLGRIEERSGRSPRHIADLVDLLVAIALDDASV